MRSKRRRGKPRNRTSIYYGDVYYDNHTSITNVTNVTNVEYGGGRRHERHKHGQNRDHGDKKPEMFRFFASCGIADREKAAKRSNGQLFDDAIEIERYAGREFSKSASLAARGAGKIGGALVDGVCGILSCIFG